jgi:hypothetical protein
VFQLRYIIHRVIKRIKIISLVFRKINSISAKKLAKPIFYFDLYIYIYIYIPYIYRLLVIDSVDELDIGHFVLSNTEKYKLVWH